MGDVAGNGPIRCYSIRHRMPFKSINKGSKCVLMTWRAMGQACCSPRHLTCSEPSFIESTGIL